MRIGVGLSIPELATRGGKFSPASLFSGGAKGAWYDPSDYSTLFQDSAGTTPVTAVEQPVGLMLDKSQGLVLGPELADEINTPAGWIPYGTNTVTAITGGVAITYVGGTNASNGAYVLLNASSLTTNLTVGKTYRLTLEAAINTGSATIKLWTGASTVTTHTVSSSTFATFSYTFVCGGTGDLSINSNLDAGEVIQFRNISVKELPGNHASQSTAASRPVLRARYNLLTYSEQFDNAAWSKSGLNTTGTPAWVNAAVAPDGTTTADFLIPQATTANHSVNSVASAASAGINTFSVYAKAGGYNYLQMLWGSGTDYANFNLTGAGSVSQSSGASPTITSVGNGWYRCTITSTLAGASTVYLQPVPLGTETRYATYLGDAVSGVYIWGADLRTGSSAGTYQRIAAATDYATAGFLPYLAFSTDDSFSTGSIDFSATDAMFACAGISKLSDSATGILWELSADSNSNAGSCYITAPQSSLQYFGSFSRGSVAPASAAVVTSSSYAAPITVVQSMVAKVSTDTNLLRLNGAQVASQTADQGTGNYGNYSTFIGRRNNTSFPFNGNFYQLVVCGKTLSAAELASTEAFVATKTGVTL
jgi:hypothetical protein